MNDGRLEVGERIASQHTAAHTAAHTSIPQYHSHTDTSSPSPPPSPPPSPHHSSFSRLRPLLLPFPPPPMCVQVSRIIKGPFTKRLRRAITSKAPHKANRVASLVLGRSDARDSLDLEFATHEQREQYVLNETERERETERQRDRDRERQRQNKCHREIISTEYVCLARLYKHVISCFSSRC